MPRRKSTVLQADDVITLGQSPVNDQIETNEMSTELLEAPVKPVKVKGERLAGEELMQFVQENKDQPIDDVVYNAGFYTKTTDPETGETKTTLHKPQFFQALSVASTGVEFAPPKRAYTARKGRSPVVTVGKTGNVVVGGRHSVVAGFEPGSKVHVASEAGRIILTPYEGAEDEAGEDEGDDLDL